MAEVCEHLDPHLDIQPSPLELDACFDRDVSCHLEPFITVHDQLYTIRPGTSSRNAASILKYDRQVVPY